MPIQNKTKSSGSMHNPFRTYSNHIYPKTINDAFKWALWFWDRNAKYRTAVQKVVSYFVSGFTVSQDTGPSEEVDPDVISTFESLLDDTYNAQSFLVQFGIELAAMGNVFVSAERILSRSLLCPREDCGWQMAVKHLRKGRDYEWQKGSFKGKCPKCGKDVTYNIKDTQATDSEGRKLRFIFRDAVDMHIQFNRLTGTYRYFYKMPHEIRDAINRGDSVYLEDSPKVFLEAAKSGSLIEFPADNFFSMRTNTLSSLDTMYKGWGIPLFMTSFDNFIRLQHLDKFNEAITMDYIAPTRMISPAPQNLQAGVTDPNRMSISGDVFRNFIQNSLKQVKENPTTWIVSPIPVNYQMLGGEAKDLAPVELMEWYVTQILSDMGIPSEFRQTSFQVVAPTMGLRMFERQWIHFAKGLNKCARWKADRIAQAHNMENMTCELDMTSFVEDDMNKHTLLQLMQGGIIAKTNVLKRFGVDFKEDAKLRIQEQKQEEELAQEQMDGMEDKELVASVMPPAGAVGIGQAQMNIEQMQQQAMGGAGAQPQQPGQPQQPMQPMGGGGGMPFNQGQSQSAGVEQMFQDAMGMAQELYNVPQQVRTQQLIQLKTTNPELHAMVKQQLTDMKQQVASDAVAQSQQPQG